MLALLLLLLQSPPEETFGHKIGADEKLPSWEKVVSFYRRLEKESDRVRVEEKGTSTEGRPILLVTVTSAANLKRIDAIQAMQRKIASGDDKEAGEAPAVVMFIATQHSTEVASTQTLCEFAHALAAAKDKATLELLDRSVVLLVASANPDGVDHVADWYGRTKGKPWEGAEMPWLYQKYVGHDNNRDWFMLTQTESRIIAKILYEEWCPVVAVDLHQMGSRGARFFVSPFTDPINPNIHPVINQQQLLIGGHVVTDLTMAGKGGAVHTSIFDNWWHGDLSAGAHRHNITGILTESASARLASPIFLRKGELSETQPQANFADPWPGGWWRLRDIVDYQLISNRSVLELSAKYRDRFNRNQAKMARDAIAKGRSEPPFAYVLPDTHAGVRLLQVLRRGAVEVHRAGAAFKAGGVDYPSGTYVVPLAQPYRAHVKDLMERQKYPDRFQYPGGPVETPYDVTGWTLPLQVGARAVEIVEPFDAKLEKAEPKLKEGTVRGDGKYCWRFPHATNESFIALQRLLAAGARVFVERGSAYVFAKRDAVEPVAKELGLDVEGLDAKPATAGVVEQKAPRLGLYAPWTASMDEGWTRFVFERHALSYTTLRNAQVRAGNLRDRFDAIVIPSIGVSTLIDGRAKDTCPAEYVGGIGEDGVIALQAFVEAGGSLICLDSSCALALQHFGIGVRDASKDETAKEGAAKPEPFACPGSIVAVRLDASSPLTWGMGEECAAFVDGPMLLAVGPGKKGEKETPEQKAERERLERAAKKFPAQLVGTYPDSLVLLSGWMRREDLMAGKGAIVDVAYGKGRIVLFGIRPQHRAQTEGTFRLLFNAIYRARSAASELP